MIHQDTTIALEFDDGQSMTYHHATSGSFAGRHFSGNNRCYLSDPLHDLPIVESFFDGAVYSGWESHADCSSLYASVGARCGADGAKIRNYLAKVEFEGCTLTKHVREYDDGEQLPAEHSLSQIDADEPIILHMHLAQEGVRRLRLAA